MITAWEKYKEKSQKQGSGKKMRQQGGGGASALCRLIQTTRGKLPATDSSTWSEEEKNTVREHLTGLIQEVQAAIDRL